MTDITIGIDNGLDGGLCALRNSDCSIVSYIATPTHAPYDKREVNLLALHDWVGSFGFDKVTVCLEEPLKHAKTSQAMRSMAISFGQIDGVYQILRRPVQRIQVTDWQPVMLGKGRPKGQTKVIALQQARKFWPEEKWLASNRCKVPHDGIVDAALIARYYITKQKHHERN
jgi:hypothetical protein